MNSKRGKKQKKIIRYILLGFALVVLLLIFSLVFFLKDVPNPASLSRNDFPQSSRIYDSHGQLLYEIFADRRRTPVTLDQIPESLKKATLAIEDANFYKHGGFDIKGIIRGLYRTIFQKRLQGGSTLTQQLVKNALLSPERTWSRKIKEAFLTLATEILYSKDQILEMYFNQTPYGGTLWGAEAAAHGIFNKNVRDLSPAESALLAGLPGSPTRYSPFAHPEAAKNRQEMVLTRMLELGMITSSEKDSLLAKPLNYYLDRQNIKAPHFVFYIKEKLINQYGLDRVTKGGLKVDTTLDYLIQDYAQTVVASEVAKLAKSRVSNGAVLVTEPKSGAILAMVGSKDYFATDIEGKYNITTAQRQPGSSIKPINYAVGIELGKVTAASVFNDEPTCFMVENQKPYCPTNYGNHYFGVQTLRNSLANSLNIPAVKMLKINGLSTFVASASAMGITSLSDPSNYGLSLTLGGGEVSMVEMATAFGTLANMGINQPVYAIKKVTDKSDVILEENNFVPGQRVLSRETSFIIQQILSDDNARSMVFGRGSMLNIKGHSEVAVKTGTTNDMRDNWTIGYTPDYVVVAWVGNNDNSRMGGLVSGSTGAAPIWNLVTTKILESKPVKKPSRPAQVVSQTVCNLTGLLPPEGGCDSHQEYFKAEFVPKERASLKNMLLIDKDTQRPVKEGETKTNVEWQEKMSVKDISGEWVCLECPRE